MCTGRLPTLLFDSIVGGDMSCLVVFPGAGGRCYVAGGKHFCVRLLPTHPQGVKVLSCVEGVLLGVFVGPLVVGQRR